MWDVFYTARPYLDTAPDGYPREVYFLMRGDRVRVVSRESDGSDVVRFEAGPYRPSPTGRDDRGMADDVQAFAVAYVERPEEFGREPTDVGQVHAAWWRAHGDAIACEVGE